MDDPEVLEKVIETLRRGDLIVYPTDTVYGIGGDATSEKVVKKVFQIKQRPANMPISVLVSDIEMLSTYAEISEEQMKIIKKSLPGPFTFILKPKVMLPVSDKNIGFRIPDHWCTLIPKKLGRPITTTSANVSNNPTPNSIEEIEEEFKDSVSMYIDEGTLEGKPSKVIDLTQTSPKVIRE